MHLSKTERRDEFPLWKSPLMKHRLFRGQGLATLYIPGLCVNIVVMTDTLWLSAPENCAVKSLSLNALPSCDTSGERKCKRYNEGLVSTLIVDKAIKPRGDGSMALSRFRVWVPSSTYVESRTHGVPSCSTWSYRWNTAKDGENWSKWSSSPG